MSMMCKINKSELPGRPLSFFDALFGRCTGFYGHFLVDVVTAEESTHISSSNSTPVFFKKKVLAFWKTCFKVKVYNQV